jgi:DNA mismatch repair protein MutS2
MDAKSQVLLEFPLIRERLAAATGFAPSRRLAAALEPSPDPVVVARGLDETDQARQMLEERPGVGIGAARDIGAAIERAARSGRLEPGQLVEIMDTLAAAAKLGEALGEERRPLLRALGRRLQPLPNLRLRLESSLDPSGELLDSASPSLGGLRRAVRVAYERLRSRLEGLVHGSELSAALQEPIITLRNGRYVIPVRADAKGRVKGIVHDQSGSGQTLFIEPLVVVELGNTWREAQLSVQSEEERILDALSALVGTHADALRETLGALADLDFWMAKARLAGEMDGVRAATASEPVVELRSARHPGLSGRVVPIDVQLGGEFTALVITGPNTGGKTVTLRTLGLLALMHQAGLHVPAAVGSRLPIFDDVFADIGDEQSVAQSLSTFSGHLRSIVRIVGAAGPGCLVLLDELGAGTDPTEGSALAQALLDHFIHAGALVAATTHYAELKTYGHNTPGARNASVEFDLESLSPTYRLTIGLPGTSQAFAIAERLGLPAALVEDARGRLSRAQVEFEATLASIRTARDTADAAVERARQTEERAGEARRTAEIERARARRERDDSFVRAREEAERALAAVRQEIRTTRAALERGGLSGEGLDALETGLARSLAAIPAPRGTQDRQAPEVALAAPAWRVGMRARSLSAGWEGRIAALERGGLRATLEVGGMRVAVDVADLVAAVGPAAAATGPGGGVPTAGSPRAGRRGVFGVEARAASEPARAMPAPLDLRGAKVEEAMQTLDRYLDGASLAGSGRVTIIHGHGSGALRDAVRAALALHPLVREWRPGGRGEGGDGASVVTL